jgi:membrane associated rhomboid family serine protease
MNAATGSPAGSAPDPRPAPKGSLLTRAREAPVLCALTGVNLAVMVYAESFASTTTTLGLIRSGADEATIVWMGDFWRLATSMFLHIGWGHFLWNTYASWGWCAPVEKELGHGRFLATYLFAGVGGGCLSVLGHDVVAAGASGACFGIIGARLALEWRAAPDPRAFFASRKTRGILRTTGIWIALGLTVLPMDNFAHAGGLVAGIAATLLLTTGESMVRSAGALTVATWVFFIVGTRPWHIEPTPIEVQFLDVYGWAYSEGKSLARDPQRAARFLRLACDNGSGHACGALGSVVGDRGTPEAYAEAMGLYRKACAAREGWACGSAGYLFAKGLGTPVDRGAANDFYARGCDAGCAECCPRPPEQAGRGDDGGGVTASPIPSAGP